MNIIELVRDILTNYPKMSEFTNGIHVDFTDNSKIIDYGLKSTGDTRLSEDILGNQKRKHSFVLYAVNQTLTDYDRLANSSFLLELSYWLESITKDKKYEIEVTVNEHKRKGILEKLECANAMLFDIPTEDISDGGIYQLQIYAQYTLETEV